LSNSTWHAGDSARVVLLRARYVNERAMSREAERSTGDEDVFKRRGSDLPRSSSIFLDLPRVLLPGRMVKASLCNRGTFYERTTRISRVAFSRMLFLHCVALRAAARSCILKSLDREISERRTFTQFRVNGSCNGSDC